MDFRKLTDNDLPQVAGVHHRAYGKDHFTALFPERLLCQFYGQLLAHNQHCYAAVNQTQVLGFIVAGEKTDYAVKQFSDQHARELMWLLCRHPTHLVKKIQAKLFPIRFTSEATLRLLSIAVDPAQAGQGVGQFLLRSFEHALKEHGVHSYGLSVKKANARAVRLYDRSDMEREYETKHALFYIKQI